MFNHEIILRSQQRFRSDHHRVYTEEVNTLALSSNDDKRIQAFDKITTYPYGANIFKTCENEMLLKNKFIIKYIDKDNNQKLRDKSQVLRDEAQALRKESLLVRNEIVKIRNEAQALRNKSQKIRSEAQALRDNSHKIRSEPQVLRDKSQVLRSEVQVVRNESLLIINELHKIRSEAPELRNSLHKIRSEAQALRNELQEYKDESQALRDNPQKIKSKAQVLKNKSFLIKDKIKSEEEKVLEKNKIIDQVNQTAKVRVDYLININEIVMMMNKLNEDPNTSLFKLDKINALLDKSLDCAWKLGCVKKRKKHMIINDEDKDTYLDRYTNIVNNKLDLVNQTGELIDTYVSDAYNIVDGINKCHNNTSLYYILEEDF